MLQELNPIGQSRCLKAVDKFFPDLDKDEHNEPNGDEQSENDKENHQENDWQEEDGRETENGFGNQIDQEKSNQEVGGLLKVILSNTK